MTILLEGRRIQMPFMEDAVTDLCPTKVETAARNRLAKAGYRPLHSITCRFRKGTLVLQGKVASYHHKQVAQEAMRKVKGVETIVNKIEVWT